MVKIVILLCISTIVWIIYDELKRHNDAFKEQTKLDEEEIKSGILDIKAERVLTSEG